MGSRTSISTWRSSSCWETGCDDGSIRPPLPITARVIEIDAADEIGGRARSAVRVIATERTGTVTPTERSVVVAAPRWCRRDGVITFGPRASRCSSVGWLVVDAALRVSAAPRLSAPPVMAAVAISAGVPAPAR
jgi:hypothetical protein